MSQADLNNWEECRVVFILSGVLINQEGETLWEGIMLQSSPFPSGESCCRGCNAGGEQVSSWVSNGCTHLHFSCCLHIV